MTRFDKLYNQIVNNPKDVKFEDLDKLLTRAGFECRQPRSGSSHYTYHHPKLIEVLSIPKARPIKAIYVKKAIAAIESVGRDEV